MTKKCDALIREIVAGLRDGYLSISCTTKWFGAQNGTGVPRHSSVIDVDIQKALQPKKKRKHEPERT